MNVDDLAFKFFTEFFAQDLHVASQNNQLNTSGLDVVTKHCLECALVCLAGNRVHLKWHTVKLCKALEVIVVTKNHWQLNRKLTRTLTEQHVI